MPTLFPNAVDNFTNPTAADSLNTAGVLHADQHTNANDAIEAMEQDILQRGTFTIDFGSTPTYSKLFTVSFPGLAAGKVIHLFQIFRTTTDEDEMDALLLRGYSEADEMTIYADTWPGPVVGEYQIGYRYF